jgi:hypothetical protein
MTKKEKIDIQDEGSIVLFTPLDVEAREWLEEPWQWLGKLCRHPLWIRPPRSKTFEVCRDCGDRFPCKTCDHADCTEARAAGAIDNWPAWVRSVPR